MRKFPKASGRGPTLWEDLAVAADRSHEMRHLHRQFISYPLSPDACVAGLISSLPSGSKSGSAFTGFKEMKKEKEKETPGNRRMIEPGRSSEGTTVKSMNNGKVNEQWRSEWTTVKSKNNGQVNEQWSSERTTVKWMNNGKVNDQRLSEWPTVKWMNNG